MAGRSKLTPLKLKPLVGSFDSRSMPENVSEGSWRLLLNTRTDERGTLSRAPGWQSFLRGFVASRDYHNEDGHDQLLSLQTYFEKLDEDSDDSAVITYPNIEFCGEAKLRTQGRQPYTFLAEVVSSIGTRTVLRGTQSRLYELIVGKGTSRILCDGLGGISDNPEIRLRHSQTGDFVLFTNNYDDPFYWVIGNGAFGCSQNSTSTIPDLITMGVRKALVTFQFRGVTFLCNNEEDGIRYTNRVRWSDADPTSWIQDPGFSLAGEFDLDPGEEILAGDVIGNFAYLHTTRGTWQVSVSNDPLEVFRFEKLYTGVQGEACIAYPFTFVSDGEKHRYMAKDGIYAFVPAFARPEREEWIHQSSNVLYDTLNKSRCAIHTAGFDPVTQQLYFSCALGDEQLPSVTLGANVRYEQCSKLDFGATAFLSCTPSTTQSYREWLIDNCICSEDDLDSDELRELGFQTVKEGEGVVTVSVPCTSYPDSIYTTETITIVEAGLDDIVMENYEADPSPNSICNSFPEATLADLCLHCEGETVFSFAHAEDWAIKTMGGAYSREMFVFDGFEEGDVATYTYDAYRSRMLKGPLAFGTSEPKTIEHLSIEFAAAASLSPLWLNFSLGTSVRAEDPLDDANQCNIEWNPQDPKPLSCLADDRFKEWPLFYRREAIYFDFWIDGKGGEASFSSLEAKVRTDPMHV